MEGCRAGDEYDAVACQEAWDQGEEVDVRSSYSHAKQSHWTNRR